MENKKPRKKLQIFLDEQTSLMLDKMEEKEGLTATSIVRSAIQSRAKKKLTDQELLAIMKTAIED